MWYGHGIQLVLQGLSTVANRHLRLPIAVKTLRSLRLNQLVHPVEAVAEAPKRLLLQIELLLAEVFAVKVPFHELVLLQRSGVGVDRCAGPLQSLTQVDIVLALFEHPGMPCPDTTRHDTPNPTMPTPSNAKRQNVNADAADSIIFYRDGKDTCRSSSSSSSSSSSKVALT